LLLRASGIGTIASTGKKHRLVREPVVFQQWQELNPTEQYFSLLEAWWSRGSDEVIGERERFGMFDHRARSLEFFMKLSKEGLKIAGYKEQEEKLKHLPGYHSLALLELFGFITIQEGEPEQGKGWCVKSITPTEWGKVVLESISVVKRQVMDGAWEDASVEEMQAAAFKEWKTVAQPYVADWDKVLTSPEASFQPGDHIFKVSIGRAWRKIAVSGEAHFDTLAATILKAFDFNNDHLYQFIYNDRYGLKKYINHYALEEVPFTDEVRLGEVPLSPGMEMTFLFDFGDSWEFQVQVEEIVETSDRSEPALLKRHGKAPEQYPDYDDM
jgi:hypothetical protein